MSDDKKEYDHHWTMPIDYEVRNTQSRNIHIEPGPVIFTKGTLKTDSDPTPRGCLAMLIALLATGMWLFGAGVGYFAGVSGWTL